jgi:threonine synthase
MMGKKRVRVFMLSPHGRMSDFQRAQMYTIQDPDIHNIAIIGMFDDAQDVVKAVSNDAAFKARYKIGAVNSINWARVAIQVVYYFKGYFAATQNNDQRVDFAVPTGNFGDICAGHVARMMGLPIRQLVLATNENDVLDEFFRTGTYRPRTGTYVTSSPSMDISKASNFERFMFDAVGREAEIVRTLWNDVGTKGYFDLPSGPYHRYWDDPPFDSIKDFGIVSGSSTHTDRMHTIRNVWRRYGVMIDTHTADALKVAREYRDTDIPMVVLETAQACKFEKDVREATGEVPPRPKDLAGIELYPQRVQPMEANVEAVKAYIAKVCNPTSEHLARDGSNI